MDSPTKSPAKRTVCVFCGSSVGRNVAYLETARRAGELLALKGYRMVYGGGASGMMGEVARAALAAGAEVIGIRPSPLDHLERPQSGMEMIHTPDLFDRKQRMIAMSDAFIVLPGGLGTLDEFFEVVTTAQLGMHSKPIVVVSTEDYFATLFALLRHCGSEGFIYRDVTRLIHVVDTADEAIALL
jgi:uncharacterized protein (TIGR00730 family)